jgi:glycyl-tRNA synthetase beta chain
MVDAVLANRPPSPLDADDRLQALREFLRLPEASVLTAVNKRIGNILRRSQQDAHAAVQPSLFIEEAERRLHRELGELQSAVRHTAAARRYGESLRALLGLSGAVDDFFEHIMVMDENLERRANRLALLHDVQQLLGTVADLSRLPG